ncbi:MAG TPA: SDR family oxidoreductase [Candidatus Omnitrophota bacterium]|nr:SDR family oxidoreductase [Candidatus Omnitrophota bacterium]
MPTNNPPETSDIFCDDLPSAPLSEAGKILVSGASGYIGGRLVPELLHRGYKVRALVRGDPLTYKNIWPEAEIVRADVLNKEEIRNALSGIDTAYYLIHSLHLGLKEFEKTDILAARSFRDGAQEQGVKRIVYLGGLGDVRSKLSSHLRSRAEVAKELKKGKVPVTVLRAAVIIGSGSASYEIIQHLAVKLPLIFIPYWAKNKCQPIGVRDVIKYLVGALETPETQGRSFDIGGKDVLTYEEMLKTFTHLLMKKTIFIDFPFIPLKVYAYFASLFTPVPHTITRCLMEGLKNEVICYDNSIKGCLPFEPLSYREQVVRALSREEQDRVSTRWSDAYHPYYDLALKLYEVKQPVTYSVRYSILTLNEADKLFRSFCRIGGRRGWFYYNWLWRLRGAIDRILLGVGTIRGRKSYSHLKINDVVDFFRVEDIRENQLLLLRAEMKIPGRAWLEFNIKEEAGKRRLSVIAYYNTQSLLGKFYWHACLPLHHFLFQKLLIGIEDKAK